MPELRHFDDFAVGQRFDLGEHVLTQDEIIAFASEFDPQPQHTDPEEAKSGMLGGLVASGWHLCALSMRMLADGLFVRAGSLGAPGVDEVQWRRPARPGDHLTLSAEVLETRASNSKPDRGFVRFRIEMKRGSELVMFWTPTAMFRRKGV